MSDNIPIVIYFSHSKKNFTFFVNSTSNSTSKTKSKQIYKGVFAQMFQ